MATLRKRENKMTTINEKQFNSTIKAIKSNAESLAQSIHDAGVFAIAQANLHGNDGFAVRLMEAGVRGPHYRSLPQFNPQTPSPLLKRWPFCLSR